MGHDPTKVLLGGVQSSFKVVTNKAGSIAAGLIVRQKSDGTITTAAADGQAIGISLGKELSDISRTAICRAGLLVPVQLTAAFTPVVGAQVHISDTTGRAGTAGAGFTGMNAIYQSAVLTGVMEDGTSQNVALIDFEGGL